MCRRSGRLKPYGNRRNETSIATSVPRVAHADEFVKQDYFLDLPAGFCIRYLIDREATVGFSTGLQLDDQCAAIATGIKQIQSIDSGFQTLEDVCPELDFVDHQARRQLFNQGRHCVEVIPQTTIHL